MALNWKHYRTNGISESELAEHFVDTIFKEQDLKFFGNDSAVYFISPNAGAFSSIAFWKNALAHSPRFANPGIFPWTLANATSGYIARRFLITGPNYTLINTSLTEDDLVYMFNTDRLKFGLQSALLIFWELDFSNEKLSVSVDWSYIN